MPFEVGTVNPRVMSPYYSNASTGNEIERLEQHYLVGRETEKAAYLSWIADAAPRRKILNLFGTGGIGKSYLLNEFRRLADGAGARFVSMDCRSLRTPEDFCLLLLRRLRYRTETIERDADADRLAAVCLEALAEQAGLRKTVLALDTFEDLGELEHWLREAFLSRIAPGVLAVVSGRSPLGGPWLTSPAWRQWIHRLPLADLDFDAVRLYAERSGVTGEADQRTVWQKTKGHPLTMSLLVATMMAHSPGGQAAPEDGAVFGRVAAAWLREVPEPAMKELVEAAAVLRVFNQEIVGYVLDREIGADDFRRLAEYSFVQRIDRGWLLHDLLREAIAEDLRLRVPQRYEELWKRCVLYYYRKLKRSARKKTISWENAEWFYYIGNQLIHALFYQQSVTHRMEPLSPANWEEALRYVEQRYATVREYPVRRVDPVSGQTFDYLYTVQDSLFGLKHIHLDSLYALDPGSVKLARDRHGTVCGLFVFIAINARTIDYLKREPLSAAYFSSLDESRLNELRVPGHERAGYFVKTLDVCDPSDGAMMQAAGIAFITHMLSAGFVVAAPPPHPLPRDIFLSFGAEIPDVVHYDYDERIATPYYVLDTRGPKLQDYLNRTIAAIGLADETELETEPEAAPGPYLTSRERGVADLVAEGRSNAEIAERLFISETTVKKHVAHIFKKLNVRSRAQLIGLYAARAKLKP
ncbi:helix-turn-helix transcriptional regulator [Cohnella hashimotonis]|uniref:LuxR C-terminal-related transcriptional regulator n=1 Tax=Cohnella hashimotonis TaxID=2826895 RepID=A0ABT6TQT7_9BACL|nr:LuxR C-terminal-related transcriptional regulator [Cohnella hashimotonis]MDI4648294.1 LuxR C-terminal-related transcriptional regulator [Cohnella hashimotonis]